MAYKVLVGQNSNTVPVTYTANSPADIPFSIIDPQGMFRPNPGNGTYTSRGVRGVVDVEQCRLEEKLGVLSPSEYNFNSIMSIDGLFSPVSFYPTPYNSTFSMTKYTRSKCPICRGDGQINTTIHDPRKLNTNNTFNSTQTQQAAATKVGYNRACKFCSPDAGKDKEQKESASQSYKLPPYIIAKGDDLEAAESRFSSLAGTNNRINKFNLNPIVTAGGEFSVPNGKQEKDQCVHSIETVGFGHEPPGSKGDVRGIISSEPEKNYSELDKDFLTGRYQSNQRFMGFRGPMVVHGWGYDKEGYPVPNASGEPKRNPDGSLATTSDGVQLYKNQELQSDGSYSLPYKEKAFYKGWASLPSTWPVGPIDLRWDDKAGVWGVGGTYREVWVTLEKDLSDSTPVRATLEDDISSVEPLPDGFRRLVFVKDPTGLFRAPRGAALYCKYNDDNGFYEPVYNQPFITTGKTVSATVADIDNTYTLKYAKSKIVEPYQGQVFKNPLGLPVVAGRKAIFSYIDGSWTLTNIG